MWQVDLKAELNDNGTFKKADYENGRWQLQKFCYRREHDVPGFTRWLQGKIVALGKELGAEFVAGARIVTINYASDIPKVVLKNTDDEYKREDSKAYRFENYTFYNNGNVEIYDKKTKEKEMKNSKEIIESWPQ